MNDHEHHEGCGCRPEDLRAIADELSRRWRGRRLRGLLVVLACAAATALAVWLVGV